MAMTPLRAGQLRETVTVQAPLDTPDGAGGMISSWDPVPLASPRAEVIPITGGETFKFGVERSTQFYRIRIWYRAGITTRHRVVLADGTALNIRSAEDPDRRRRELMIIAESGVADG